jgi:hypothetical protein
MNPLGKILKTTRMFSERWGGFCVRLSPACVEAATADVSKPRTLLEPTPFRPILVRNGSDLFFDQLGTALISCSTIGVVQRESDSRRGIPVSCVIWMIVSRHEQDPQSNCAERHLHKSRPQNNSHFIRVLSRCRMRRFESKTGTNNGNTIE